MLHYYSLNSLLLALRNENNTEREKLTQTPTSELGISLAGRENVGACWWRLLPGSDWFIEFRLPLLVYQQTSDRNYWYLQRVSDLSKASFSEEKNSNFLCNSPPTLWCYRWRKRNWQTTKTFGFCVNWLRNSERLNRLSNMTRQAFVLWKNFCR